MNQKDLIKAFRWVFALAVGACAGILAVDILPGGTFFIGGFSLGLVLSLCLSSVVESLAVAAARDEEYEEEDLFL